MTGSPRSSVSVLHKQWSKLEDKHHELAIAIDTARVGSADLTPLRDRQARLLLEIDVLVAEIQEAPATTIEDFLALLDVALEHETDLACDIAFYGPADYPILTRLFRALMPLAPGFEFNSLRRWLSAPGQLESLIGREKPAAGSDTGRVKAIGFGDAEMPPAER